MATPTYEVITTATVDGSTPTISVTVPSGYKNLRLVANLRSGDSRSGYQSVSYRFNNDSTSSYSGTILYGNGSTASSYRQSAQVIEGLTVMNGTSTGSYFYTNILDVMSPTNGTTFTPVLIDMSNGGLGAYKQAAVYRKNDVITSIQIIEASNINWVAGSSVTLYGIGSGVGGDVTTKATGGELFSDSTHYYHVFKGVGTFKPLTNLTADILVVAGGGGGGGGTGAGGGGAGGMLEYTSQSLTTIPYTCTVGAGGAAGWSATSGGNSVFGSLTAAIGGGYGASQSSGGGASGGSGGGGQYAGSTAGGTGTSGQGYAGGQGIDRGGNTTGGGGGGGKGAIGNPPPDTSNAGSGGVGAVSSISGGATTAIGQLVSGNYYLAGGGGGGVVRIDGARQGGAGGYGGGGVGGGLSGTSGQPGTANTGGGGGGHNESYAAETGRGGSGIIIVRYAK